MSLFEFVCIVVIPTNSVILQYFAVNASCIANQGALKFIKCLPRNKIENTVNKGKIKRRIHYNVNILNVSNAFQVFNQILPIERFL